MWTRSFEIVVVAEYGKGVFAGTQAVKHKSALVVYRPKPAGMAGFENDYDILSQLGNFVPKPGSF